MTTIMATTPDGTMTGVPGGTQPEPKERWFLAPFNAGDLEAVTAFFAADAVCITQSGAQVAGREELRRWFGDLLEQKLTMSGGWLVAIEHPFLA